MDTKKTPTTHKPTDFIVIGLLICTLILGGYLLKEDPLKKDLFNKNAEKQKDGPKGIAETTLFLAGGKDSTGKVNRLGQIRNLEKIQKIVGKDPHYIQTENTQIQNRETSTLTSLKQLHPDSQIIKSPFPPLIQIKTRGMEGSITTKGDLFTLTSTYQVPNHPVTLNIHPTYNWDIPNTENQTKENLEITFTDKKGNSNTEEIPIEWSLPNQLFLSENCLPHVAALADPTALPAIKATLPKNVEITKEIIQTWINQTTELLKVYNLEYEELPQNTIQTPGWQTIRSPWQILQDRRGNCIELSIFWAGLALSQDLQVWIVILPEHALIAVGPPQSQFREAIAIETTILTGIGLKNTDTPRAQAEGTKKILEHIKLPSDKITIININYWHQFFEKPQSIALP